MSARSFPVIALISADENFAWTGAGACNTFTRNIPIEIRVYHTNENGAMSIVDNLVKHESVLQQTHEIVSVTHSDHLAQVTQYYAAFITLNFTLIY